MCRRTVACLECTSHSFHHSSQRYWYRCRLAHFRCFLLNLRQRLLPVTVAQQVESFPNPFRCLHRSLELQAQLLGSKPVQQPPKSLRQTTQLVELPTEVSRNDPQGKACGSNFFLQGKGQISDLVQKLGRREHVCLDLKAKSAT